MSGSRKKCKQGKRSEESEEKYNSLKINNYE